MFTGKMLALVAGTCLAPEDMRSPHPSQARSGEGTGTVANTGGI